MNNYRYRIDGEDVIVSQEEHGYIQEGIAKKLNLVVLRGGSLGVNPMFIRKFTETDTPTALQEKEKYERLRLGVSERQPTEEDRERRRELNAKFIKEFSERTKI